MGILLDVGEPDFNTSHWEKKRGRARLRAKRRDAMDTGFEQEVLHAALSAGRTDVNAVAQDHVQET